MTIVDDNKTQTDKLASKNEEIVIMDLNMSHKMVCAGGAACTADLVSFPLDVSEVKSFIY